MRRKKRKKKAEMEETAEPIRFLRNGEDVLFSPAPRNVGEAGIIVLSV